MNFTFRFFPDEHQQLLQLLLLKSQQDKFQALTLGNKILYLETVNRYQNKLQRRILTHWNKKRREFSVSFKPYEAELIIDFIYDGSAHYPEQLLNVARILQRTIQKQNHDANHFLTQLQNQITWKENQPTQI